MDVQVYLSCFHPAWMAIWYPKDSKVTTEVFGQREERRHREHHWWDSWRSKQLQWIGKVDCQGKQSHRNTIEAGLLILVHPNLEICFFSQIGILNSVSGTYKVEKFERSVSVAYFAIPKGSTPKKHEKTTFLWAWNPSVVGRSKWFDLVSVKENPKWGALKAFIWCWSFVTWVSWGLRVSTSSAVKGMRKRRNDDETYAKASAKDLLWTSSALSTSQEVFFLTIAVSENWRVVSPSGGWFPFISSHLE